MDKRGRKKDASTLKKVLAYIKKYYLLLVVSIFFALLHVVCTLYIPIVVGKTIDAIVGPGNVNFSLINKYLVLMVNSLTT